MTTNYWTFTLQIQNDLGPEAGEMIVGPASPLDAGSTLTYPKVGTLIPPNDQPQTWQCNGSYEVGAGFDAQLTVGPNNIYISIEFGPRQPNGEWNIHGIPSGLGLEPPHPPIRTVNRNSATLLLTFVSEN